jgi:hypothetical protein
LEIFGFLEYTQPEVAARSGVRGPFRARLLASEAHRYTGIVQRGRGGMVDAPDLKANKNNNKIIKILAKSSQ